MSHDNRPAPMTPNPGTELPPLDVTEEDEDETRMMLDSHPVASTAESLEVKQFLFNTTAEKLVLRRQLREALVNIEESRQKVFWNKEEVFPLIASCSLCGAVPNAPCVFDTGEPYKDFHLVRQAEAKRIAEAQLSARVPVGGLPSYPLIAGYHRSEPKDDPLGRVFHKPYILKEDADPVFDTLEALLREKEGENARLKNTR